MTAKKFRTVNFANDYRPYETSCVSERTKSQIETSWDNSRLSLSSDFVMNVEEVDFDAYVEITLFSAKIYKVEGTLKSPDGRRRQL